MAPAKHTSASTGSSHARTPTSLATAIVVSANAWSPIDASVTETSDDTGARSGATTASAPVTTAPASARRRAIESASPSVSEPMGRLGGGPGRPGQEVAAGHPRRHRLDERPDRDEVGVLAHELVGDRRPSSAATASSRRISSTLSANVGPSSTSRLKWPASNPERGEDRADDDEHPDDDGRVHRSARHAVIGVSVLERAPTLRQHEHSDREI